VTTVRFWIPGPLRSLTGARDQVDVETSGATLREAMEALFKAHPGLRDRVLTEQGGIREHVNVFIGNVDVRSTGGLATPIPEGAHVSLMPAISGG
jgi:molybdopterin synthase sulfur carrier subunit